MKQLETGTLSQDKKAEIHSKIGFYYWQNGEIELAIKHFEEAIKQDDRQAQTWANLGANYLAAGQYTEAIKALEAALKIKADLEFSDRIKQRLYWLKKITVN